MDGKVHAGVRIMRCEKEIASPNGKLLKVKDRSLNGTS